MKTTLRHIEEWTGHKPERRRPNGLLCLLVFLAAMAALICLGQSAECHIAWEPVPGASVYRVWRGIEVLDAVPSASAAVELPSDELSTLTVTASNDAGESAHSEPLVVMPVVPQSSTSLTAWVRHRPFFVEATPAAFFRLTYPKP